MFEVIWSWSADRYIVRPLGTPSSIKPALIGEREECEAWASAHN